MFDHPHDHQHDHGAAGATAGLTEDQRHGTCAIAPSPELRERWSGQLDTAQRRLRGDDSARFTLRREPRRLGFNDGVIVPPEEFPVGTPLQAIRNAAADRAPLRGTVRVAVVLVDFSDHAMTQTTQHFSDLFFSTGVLPHGSVREYYQEVTNGLVTLDGTVVGPYRMPQTLAWYAANGSGIGLNSTPFRSPQLARDAAAAADPAINFAPYDNDGNGYVDAFIVVHAGSGAEVTGSLNDIWSHKSTLSSVYNADGTRIYGYLTIPEDARIGVSAHELGHLLFGFPDLYDTDYSSEGIGNWCLMAGGSWNGGGDVPAHPSAWCKANQGWASVTNVTTNGTITVPAIETGHTMFRLWQNGASGSEYFLLENRQQTGYDADLPGSGLLLWHVDENQPGNTDENHYKVGLLQADGRRDLELDHNRGDAGDPFPGSANTTAVNDSTSPNTRSYAGASTSVTVSHISASGPSMTADVTVRTKSVIKDIKDVRKDGKEISKDLKDRKEVAKEIKEVRKEVKEIRKEVIKEVKEARKDLKDRKEVAKEIKENAKEAGENWPGGGGDGGGFAPSGPGDDLEQRVAALEALVYGDPDAAGAADGGTETAASFIDPSLRPDLIGAPGTGPDPQLAARMAAGDAGAKRVFDTRI
ncbi:immune inhibitor A [Friedmanniella endophytica]|uniref:Immune inhibitor A n=1 Tax=Microlunatus kandeliicorticis TaxID=1759536 RepID=A0A7W3P418_9ACTN|nr:M6 family metalloprotease domain-containing protein [Microlunatus kandeliicorticis]MBA8792418.1 immune inhibitor A [Microlunatus kandeliicorticis]